MSTETTGVQARLESTAFPSAQIRIHKLRGHEAISQLYYFELEILSLDEQRLDDAGMIGADVDLVFELDGREVRRLSSVIVEIVDLFTSLTAHRGYKLRLEPRISCLSQIETQAIFTDLSVPDLIKQKLDLVGLGGGARFHLAGKYPSRDFVVQYRETDLAFISRLTEHLGISFHFEQTGEQAEIVFSDQNQGFAPGDPKAPLTFSSGGQESGVYRLEARRRVIPSLYVVQDYNYRTPQLDMTSSSEVPSGAPGGVVEFGTHHKTPEEGAVLANVRAEERRSSQYVFTGVGSVLGLAAGTIQKLVDHPDLDAPELLIVEVEHEATLFTADGGKTYYRNTFRAIDSAQTTFRPARATPKPRISGVLSGVIHDGNSGIDSYAFLDQYGRYLVRFLFDTASSEHPTISKPIRMAQPHVGADYGMHFPLKPGIEVMVAFVDGDPDRPVIVGAVPNMLTPSPVSNRIPKLHRIKTSTGVVVDMGDK